MAKNQNEEMDLEQEEMTVTLTLDDGSEVDADGNPSLDNIEDDDEYEVVADAFDELLDDQEFDEIVGEDDLD